MDGVVNVHVQGSLLRCLAFGVEDREGAATECHESMGASVVGQPAPTTNGREVRPRSPTKVKIPDFAGLRIEH